MKNRRGPRLAIAVTILAICTSSPSGAQQSEPVKMRITSLREGMRSIAAASDGSRGFRVALAGNPASTVVRGAGLAFYVGTVQIYGFDACYLPGGEAKPMNVYFCEAYHHGTSASEAAAAYETVKSAMLRCLGDRPTAETVNATQSELKTTDIPESGKPAFTLQFDRSIPDGVQQSVTFSARSD